MKRSLLTFLCVVMISSVFSQEMPKRQSARKGEAAGYSTRDASVISMMGWGVGLAVGIATFCALMDQSSSGGSSGGGGGGSGGHTH